MKASNMNRLILIYILYLFCDFALFAEELQTPKVFLGYDLGEKFTYHHRVIDYFEHVTEAANHVNLVRYGNTYEGRPLVYAVITHPSNKKSIKTIRTNHLKRSGLMQGQDPRQDLVVVWLSYSVHGNESSSTEAAMKTLYDFADINNENTMDWLKKTVVIIDPCINPDGRDRYVQYYTMTGNHPPDVNSLTREHQEPWPGGRTNHYYFDLNRDWSWQSQIETVNRVAEYNKWMPHIHVDYHEQYHNEPYYFAPAAKPYHEKITPWQRELQVLIGENHARYFDKENWLYFTREIFDLLYPGYGDTYPIYNGAIGMTYEQGGGALGGLAVKTSDRDTLTLKERVQHHYITGLSTVQTAHYYSKRIISEFQKFFARGRKNDKEKFHAFVVNSSNPQDKVDDLLNWLDYHGIDYGVPENSRSRGQQGFNYRTQKAEQFTLDGDDIVIPVAQAKSVLTYVMFEPNTIYTDSLTYDLTAWSIPYVYGLDAYAVTMPIKIGKRKEKPAIIIELNPEEKPYAYIQKWESIHDLKFLADLLVHKVVLRVAEKPFEIGKNKFDRGSLVITRRGNENLGDRFDKVVAAAAKKHQRSVFSVSSGLVSSGKDFGSETMRVVTAPKVALLSGDGVSSRNFGEIWHYFEQQIEYPVSVFHVHQFDKIPLHDFDVLIMPEGNYTKFFKQVTVPSDAVKKDLKSVAPIQNKPPSELLTWIKAGGRLILVGSAMDKFVDQKGFGLVKYESETAKKAAEKYEKEKKLQDRLQKYDQRDRYKLRDKNYGSILKVKLDNTHPLAFGYDNNYFTLKLRSKVYPYLSKGWNVGIVENNAAHMAGYMGSRVKKELKNALIFGVQDMDKGNVTYLGDNPLFRAFWYNGNVLFGNAVFIVGQ